MSINIYCWMLVLLTLFFIYLLMRSVHLNIQIDKYRNKGYDITTFKSVKIRLLKFWILDIKQFMTEETFLDRL